MLVHDACVHDACQVPSVSCGGLQCNVKHNLRHPTAPPTVPSSAPPTALPTAPPTAPPTVPPIHQDTTAEIDVTQNTGSLLWDAAYVLARFLEGLVARRPAALAGKRCLELGSGTGKWAGEWVSGRVGEWVGG